MLTKYDLVNVPERGVDHLVGGRRYSITERLTDQEAQLLINAGVTQYFRPKPVNDNGKITNNPTGASAKPVIIRQRDARGRFI